LKNENSLVALMIRVALQGLALSLLGRLTRGRWTEQTGGLSGFFGRVDSLPEFSRHACGRAGVNAPA
jgi:hypothetical protein